jgi:hypothetical protein
MKKIIFLVIALAMVLSLAIPALANQNDNNTSTPPALGLKKKVAEQIDWVCVQTVTDKREGSVYSAYEIKANAIMSALKAKRTALQVALKLTDQKERVKARNKAWSDYKTAVKNANKTYRDAVNAAWKQYKIDRKACGLYSEAEPVGLELSL